MFEFAWPYVFVLLPLPLLARLLPARNQAQQVALKTPILPPNIGPTMKTQGSSRWLTLCCVIAWIALVTAAARPQWLGEPISIPDEGREMILAVDLSGSMKIDDMVINGRKVDRLTMLKSVLLDFIQRRVGDRLGLILFADTAYLQAPLTYDRNTVAKLLNETVIGLVGERTAIGDAIGLGVKRFAAKDETNKVLILLTDGQNTAGNISVEQALELAKANQITLYTIGVGADQMLMQSFFGTRQVNPSQDLDEDMLTKLAEETGGQYFRARDANELEAIYQRLDQLEPIASEGRKLRPLTALFYYPLALALFLSFLPAVTKALQQLVNRLRKHGDSAQKVAGGRQ